MTAVLGVFTKCARPLVEFRVREEQWRPQSVPVASQGQRRVWTCISEAVTLWLSSSGRWQSASRRTCAVQPRTASRPKSDVHLCSPEKICSKRANNIRENWCWFGHFGCVNNWQLTTGFPILIKAPCINLTRCKALYLNYEKSIGQATDKYFLSIFICLKLQ